MKDETFERTETRWSDSAVCLRKPVCSESNPGFPRALRRATNSSRPSIAGEKSEIVSSLLLMRLTDNALYRHFPSCFCNAYGASERISQSRIKVAAWKKSYFFLLVWHQNVSSLFKLKCSVAPSAAELWVWQRPSGKLQQEAGGTLLIAT